MSTIVAVIAIVLAFYAAATVSILAAFTLGGLLRHLRRRRRRLRQRGLTDREIADALAPFGADISVWPSRAPRNGSTYETTE